MIKRNDLLKLGLAAGGASVLTSRKARAQDENLLKYLCPPDGFPDQLAKPSPQAQSSWLSSLCRRRYSRWTS
jgi:hypothetical protein